MSIEVIIPPFLQRLAGDSISVNVSGGTVRECLEQLIQLYPLLEERIFTARGTLRKGINIFVNGKSAFPRELGKKVKHSDRVYIASIIMGG
ncbi:MAG TPA: MoaD/ThiS family protein [Dehalococcoidales bacterium]|nr:MoaD/ThiS family protein [Dehalococcoidales bacterium]